MIKSHLANTENEQKIVQKFDEISRPSLEIH